MVYDSNQINIIQNKFEDLRFLPTNIDILVMEFLRTYDVFVQPSDPVIWNGWDNLATLDIFLNMSRGGGSIARSIFYSNRSEQVSQSLQNKSQDWSTWKRWALDHKDFEKFQDERTKEIEAYNNSVLKRINNPANRKLLDNVVIKGELRDKVENIYNNLKFLLYGFFGIIILGLYSGFYKNLGFYNLNQSIFILVTFVLSIFLLIFLAEFLIPEFLIWYFYKIKNL